MSESQAKARECQKRKGIRLRYRAAVPLPLIDTFNWEHRGRFPDLVFDAACDAK